MNKTPPLSLPALETATESKPTKVGRPAKLVMPPLPSAILNGMTEPEREHFEFFKASYEAAYIERYGRMTPTAQINILQASLDYVHLLRLQAEQMESKKLVSMARQHPGVQVRAWLASAGLEEKSMSQPKQNDEKAEQMAALLKLSSN